MRRPRALSPGTPCRSNLFNAVLFVISDKFTRAKHDERRALLHEGAGQQVPPVSRTAAQPSFHGDHRSNCLKVDETTPNSIQHI